MQLCGLNLATLRHQNRHFRNSSLLPLMAIPPPQRSVKCDAAANRLRAKTSIFWGKKHYIVATDSALVCAIFNRCFPGVRGFCPITLFIMPFSYCCHIGFVLSAYCLDFVYFYSFCFVFVISCLLYLAIVLLSWHFNKYSFHYYYHNNNHHHNLLYAGYLCLYS